MSDTNARRFLDAFHLIEQVLRTKSRKPFTKNEDGFSDLVRDSKELAEGQKQKLRQYARLRNAIVHNPYEAGLVPIASPREDVVVWIEAQAIIIEQPPLVKDVLKLQVPKVLTEDDDVSVFLKLAGEPTNYSQAPVRDENGRLRLITTNSVARWVAEKYTPGDGVLLDGAQVRDFTRFAEDGDRLVLKARDLRAVEAARIFGGSVGNPPAAIILTENGKNSETPLGMCVQADVAALLRTLGV
jgi:hypothetical protein